ncbi:MAG TPA: hypothetical protein V6D18_14270 [Thermosynechococcaceae cyanobacterium]
MIPVAQTAKSSYQSTLYPWCIIRLLPQMQRVVIARFRRRSEAEEFLSLVQRSNPTCSYQILFDPPEKAAIELSCSQNAELKI